MYSRGLRKRVDSVFVNVAFSAARCVGLKRPVAPPRICGVTLTLVRSILTVAAARATSEAERRARTTHSNIQGSPLGTSRCRRKLTRIRISTKKKNNNNETFQTYIVSGKSPGEMSRQTTRTFTFKIEVQIPSTCPSTATCAPVLRASNVLGVYHKYSPLIKFALEFITLVKLGMYSLTVVACWFLP